ncbi:hypothetical protein GH714_007463 [Hevea brasiliensis]|uniref:Uncharacterized protein n=1 Tax=Hevea brasiliensis TaxID=3981 RepID=A0A6A6KDZ2_HEVBR|nr:hypothetical protein GH714_007463 [Hevea brasiliensis]
MKCIQFQSSFPSLHPQTKQKHQQQKLKTQKWLCPYTQRIPARTRAIINPLILADTSPSKGGDISVLLQTGGLLLFAYGITNFVVPAFISKQYELDEETKEDSMPDKDGSIDGEEDGMTKPQSLRKK